MSPKNAIELLLLAAIWGASFLFMRVASPAFGADNMAVLRVIIAGLTLLPVFVVMASRSLAPLNKPQRIRTLFNLTVVSIGNSIIPFFLFAYATLTLEAGLTSIVNATTPLWGAFFAVILFHNKLTKLGWFGLLLGLVGAVVLTLHKLTGAHAQGATDILSILAVLAATCLYGISSNYSKHALNQAPALLVASGTMVIGSIIVAPVLWFTTSIAQLSAVPIGPWLAILALGAVCTGFAYILFYRLIEHTSATTAMSVTYLIPMFGVFFGWLFLDEPLFINMLFGGALILIGVMLTTGLIKTKK